ncbi:MAG: monovalent cation/H+ antiporter subunit D family protein [Limnochordia bacterium]|jgi:multicomponent Na+:H+ antiporter subunit D|nr:monovalent cation/H+ antiporter subunit D family protein [Limnochordia bacterium]
MLAFLIIFIPIIGGLLVYTLRMSDRVRDGFVVAVTGITGLLGLSLYTYLQNVGVVVLEYPRILHPFGVSFRIDWLSAILVTISSVIWFLVTVYSIDYTKSMHNVKRYHTFTLVTFGATLGTLVAGDLLTLFLFFELMSFASYVLVIQEGDAKALRAGFLYLIMTIGGGLALLFGILGVYTITGSVAFTAGGFLATNSTLSLLAFIGFLIGFGVKAGMFPLHVWLPEAHPVAPSPSSALLSGIMLKIGAFGLLRVIFNVYEFRFLKEVGWINLLLAGAILTILLGSIFAIMQTNLKRRLAYSSVAQMGYVLLGMALLSEQALVGDIFHIFTHAIMKSCLFLIAGTMILLTGKTEVQDFKGIGRRLPISMTCFTMASLSMIGIPPFNGFLSKWYLGLGALEVNQPLSALVLLISSLLNAVYYLPIVINAFFKKEENDFSLIKEPPLKMLLPVVILAVATVIFDLLPVNVLLNLSQITAATLFGGN